MGRHTRGKLKVEMYQMLVHIFGATDSSCCVNFTVKTVARDNLEKHSAMTIETVLRSFYVDSLLKSFTLEQEAVSLIKEMVDLMKAGEVRSTKFFSNNENVMKTFPEMERAKSLQGASLNNDIKKRTLDIKLDVVKDSFIFESLTFEIEEVTKRAYILSIRICILICFNSRNFHTKVMENEIRLGYNYR